MKAIIAITASITPIHNDPRYQPFDATYTPHHFIEAVSKAGGIPVLLPINQYPVEEVVQRFDGLLLTGGSDIDPKYYQEEPHREIGALLPERDQHEFALLEAFIKAKKPVFGVCRGLQLINVALGGSLYQDLSQYKDWTIQHVQKSEIEHLTHTIKVEANSRLSQWMKTGDRINSYHHQAIKELGKGLKASAWSTDGLIEAIESSTDDHDILAVQWHPEIIFDKTQASQDLFKDLVDRASKAI